MMSARNISPWLLVLVASVSSVQRGESGSLVSVSCEVMSCHDNVANDRPFTRLSSLEHVCLNMNLDELKRRHIWI